MSAREIITTAMCDAGLDNVQDDDADYLLTALKAAGYRLIPPGSLDRETIEKCAELVDHHAGEMEAEKVSLLPRGLRSIAAAIRALGAEK